MHRQIDVAFTANDDESDEPLSVKIGFINFHGVFNEAGDKFRLLHM